MFHLVSYLQYPLMLIAVFYVVKIYIEIFNNKNLEVMLENINTSLVFMGIALSFSTLQDPTKTQNKLSRKIYESPVKGKIFIGFISAFALLMLVIGIAGFLSSSDTTVSSVSFGILTIGIGFIGILKVAIEMFENHRLDKNPVSGISIDK